jgi:hypothetical protein
MVLESINRLQYLCDTIPVLLAKIPETDFSHKRLPGKWSKKEILGHLIDSATNNHHRIVRGQFEHNPRIAYDNQVWNEGNHYLKMKGSQLIPFWVAYNRYLLEVIRHIGNEKMSNTVETGEEGEKNVMTIAAVIEDYVDHLEHHLRQLVDY